MTSRKRGLMLIIAPVRKEEVKKIDRALPTNCINES